jgi:hypothetical protein
MFNPNIFKPKNLCLGNRGANMNLTRDMVRSGSGHRKEEDVWEIAIPVGSGKDPINLFKTGDTLHVTPSKVPSFERDLH